MWPAGSHRASTLRGDTLTCGEAVVSENRLKPDESRLASSTVSLQLQRRERPIGHTSVAEPGLRHTSIPILPSGQGTETKRKGRKDPRRFPAYVVSADVEPFNDRSGTRASRQRRAQFVEKRKDADEDFDQMMMTQWRYHLSTLSPGEARSKGWGGPLLETLVRGGTDRHRP